MSRRIVLGVLAAVAAGLLALPAAPVGAASFGPVADTYVDGAAPAANYGTRTFLRADGSPLQRTFLRFNVQGVGNPGSAVLRFYAESGSTTGIRVHAVSNTTWGETTTTHGNAPTVGAVLGSTEGFPAGTWLTVDVSGAVTGNGVVSFALTTLGSTGVKITSREGTNKPQLVAPAGSGRAGRGHGLRRRAAGARSRPEPAGHLPASAAAGRHHRAPARRGPAPGRGRGGRGRGGRRRAAGVGRPGPSPPGASPSGAVGVRGQLQGGRRDQAGRRGPERERRRLPPPVTRPPATVPPVDAAPVARVRVPPVEARVAPPAVLGRDLPEVRVATPEVAVELPASLTAIP